eukprot:TRINITY_DN1023_c0_g1_i1.p1 TRINITY_DN1023_c0_g1~~TRINITY_DN1023_c0_g1_i1.p1  ORF type:complete len:712 (-),score=111.74 TRINITY_DN1023_c0_g1_i1:89-2014(-)
MSGWNYNLPSNAANISMKIIYFYSAGEKTTLTRSEFFRTYSNNNTKISTYDATWSGIGNTVLGPTWEQPQILNSTIVNAPNFIITVRLQNQDTITANFSVYCVALQMDYTVPDVTTKTLTTSPLTTGEITTSPLTTGEITTSHEVTTAELTTSPLTTNDLTTSPLNSTELTTSPLTTEELTTSPLTTATVTTAELTTATITTKEMTTAVLTTGEVTTGETEQGDVTTADVTTAHLTTDALTTKGAPTVIVVDDSTEPETTVGSQTTGDLSTGDVTATSSEIPVTSEATGDGTSEVDGDSSSNNSNRKSVIGAAAGAAGAFLILVGVVGFIVWRKYRRVTYRRRKRSIGARVSEVPMLEVRVETPAPAPSLNNSTNINLRNEYNSLCFSDVGDSIEPNKRYRATMEDEHVIIGKFGDDSQAYVGVYDGHGGRVTVEYVLANLHQNILQELNATDKRDEEDVVAAFNRAYLKTDEGSKSSGERSGSTAISAFFKRNKDGSKTLTTANAGDARIVLNRNGIAERLTIDHKSSDKTERKRLEARGAIFLQHKVAGSLAVTRAFGDSELKEWVKAEPYTRHIELLPTDRHVILACDGLWDVVEDQQAVDFLEENKHDSAQQLAEKLVKMAIEKGTKDNVTVVVVTL